MKERFLELLFAILIVSAAFLGCGGSGDGGSSSSGSDTSSIIRAASQGAACGAAGTFVVGYVNTRSECAQLCSDNGYDVWCKGDDSTACFCG